MALTIGNINNIENGSVPICGNVGAEACLQIHINPKFFFYLSDGCMLGSLIYFNKTTRKRIFSAIWLNASNAEKYFSIFNDIYNRTNRRIDPVFMAYFAYVQTVILPSSNFSAFCAIAFHDHSIAFSETVLEHMQQI